MFEWSRKLLQVYLNIGLDGREFRNMEIMKSWKLVDLESSTVICLTELLPIFLSVLSYSMKINEDYSVSFQDSRVAAIQKDMEPSNFMNSASPSTYDIYIRITHLFMDIEELIPFVENTYKKEKLIKNKRTTCIT